jgi:hypothetical protein
LILHHLAFVSHLFEMTIITNAAVTQATGKWIITTYSQRNWVEVFYREAKGWLGLKEY